MQQVNALKWSLQQLGTMYLNASTLPQYLYACVRYLPKRQDDVLLCFEMTLRLIELQTPRQFMRLFPVSKEYDGERFQSNDYFTTMDMISSHGIDNPIGDAFPFLWDYVNPHIRIFLTSYMVQLDQHRRQNGQKGNYCLHRGR